MNVLSYEKTKIDISDKSQDFTSLVNVMGIARDENKNVTMHQLKKLVFSKLNGETAETKEKIFQKAYEKFLFQIEIDKGFM
jgi:hypothetical protein